MFYNSVVCFCPKIFKEEKEEFLVCGLRQWFPIFSKYDSKPTTGHNPQNMKTKQKLLLSNNYFTEM